MSSEGLHAPRQRLTIQTLTHHQAIASLMEELEAVDWYKQRADDCEDAALKAILLHNMREEMEHACMVMEWLRRSDPDWAEQISTYLFTERRSPRSRKTRPAMGATKMPRGAEEEAPAARRVSPPSGFTIGPLKDNGE